MNRVFLKFLPLAVTAVLLATSCSKDENNNAVVNPVVTHDNGIETVPFTLKVKTSKGLSKVSYVDEGNEVQPSFERGDQITITNEGNFITTLTYETVKNGSAIFKGDIAETIEVGTTLTATVALRSESTVVSSTTSLLDLIENCAHTYTGTFTYAGGDDSECKLTDDKAYLEIFMSPLQHIIPVNSKDYSMSEEGKVWIAIDPNKNVAVSNFISKSSSDISAGAIYTIDRSGFVDLGFPDGILWADANIGATNVYDIGNYYAWGEVTIKDSYDWTTYQYWEEGVTYERKITLTKYNPSDQKTTLEPIDDIAYQTNNKWSMPTKSDFETLISSYADWTDNYNNSGKPGYIVFSKKYRGSRDLSTNPKPHIFLPITGYVSGNITNNENYGHYWSSSLNTNDINDNNHMLRAYYLYFNWRSGKAYLYGDGTRKGGQIIRAVWRKE